jgi:putative effector of murein hydrolase
LLLGGPTQAAMVTLGLYAHTHRHVFLRQSAALMALAFVTAPTLLLVQATAGAAMGLEPAHVASVLPGSTTTGLALLMPTGLPLIRQEWVAAATAFNSGLVQVTLPLLLWATALSSKHAFARGVGIGCTAHVGGMAALIAASDVAAADAAAVALVVVGVSRSILMQTPWASNILARACGGDDRGSSAVPSSSHREICRAEDLPSG